MTKLVFLDTETSGLDVRLHEVWEVGAIVRCEDEETQSVDQEYHWFLPINLDKADLIALHIGKYFERHPYRDPKIEYSKVANETVFAREFMNLTLGAHIVGAVPNFDTEFIKPILYRNNCIPAWHYHLVDIEALAAGHLHLPPPWKSDTVFEAMGYKIIEEDRHTALGDARVVRDIYDLVMKNASQD